MAMRAPVEGAAGVSYIMRPSYDLPTLMFDHKEIEAIVVGLELLRRSGDKSLQAAAGRVTAKIADVLPDLHEAGMAVDRFVVSSFGAPEPMAADMVMLRTAVRDDHQLAINYRDKKGDASHQTVLPLAVIYYTEVTFLTVWCELCQGYRHFRADRIVACRETGETFADQAVKLRQGWHEQLIMPHDALP